MLSTVKWRSELLDTNNAKMIDKYKTDLDVIMSTNKVFSVNNWVYVQ